MSKTKRTTPRRHLAFYPSIENLKTGKLLGHLVDISMEGLKVMSQNPIPDNQEYSMRIYHPEGEFETNFEVKGRCLWCRPAVNPSIYDAGFHLPEITEEQLSEIVDLIESMGYRERGD